MRSTIKWAAAVLLLVSAIASAESVKNLYSATVPVSDQTESSLSSASRDALAQVLVKVSGSNEALDNAVVREAMGTARSHVQQYVFVRTEGAEGLSARFKFDSSYISELLSEAQLPLWTANRPRVMVWATVEQEGLRRFISPDETPELAASLLAEFDRRGVPAQFPLFDLKDATGLSLDDVWDLDGNAALVASERYGVQNVLLGRVAVLSSGEWNGEWRYVGIKSSLERSAKSPEYASYAREGVALVAEELSSRYAVSSNGSGGAVIPMTVTGVYNYEDYANIVSWLEGLELIDHANVLRIKGDRIELGLVSIADARQLTAIIELNQRLKPQPEAMGQLEYQWQK